MSWILMALTFLLILGIIALRKTKIQGDQNQALKVKKFLTSESGWIELVNLEKKPVLRGKVIKNYQDSIFMGYGIIITENLENDFLDGLEKLSSAKVKNKLIIKFGIDANSPLAFTTLKNSTDKSTINTLLTSDNMPGTVRAFFATDYLTLFAEEVEISQFDDFWDRAIRF